MQGARHEIAIETDERVEWHVITADVQQAIDATGAGTGLALVRTAHTSAAVTTNEAEARLLGDMRRWLLDLVPPEETYEHDEIHHASGSQPNAFAHIIAMLVRRPVLVPLWDATLDLGTYEDILFLELDGPRRRHVQVTLFTP